MKASDDPGDFQVREANGRFEWRRATMARFAQTLSGLTGRPVVDQTGVSGQFNIALDLNSADLAGMRSAVGFDAAPSDGPAAASIFTAIQAIGLRLESRKMPIEHLVVDSALKVPTEN